MIARRRLLAAPGLLLAAPGLLPARPLSAQPSRPIRLIVPFPGGGVMDVQARLFGHHLGAALGGAIIAIDNRPGGGTVIGTAEGARAPPDGSTLLMVANSFTIAPALSGNLPYDVQRDFVPLSLTSIIPHALAVHPDLPAQNMAEFIAHARTVPGGLSYASSGTGTSNHVNTELLARRIGARFVHVPYRGFVNWESDLLQNRVQFTLANLPSVVPAAREGRLRILAVAHTARVAALPQTPTLAEAGVPGVVSNSWFGIVAPAGVPAEICARLEAAIRGTLARADVRARLAELWIEPIGSDAETFRRFIASEIATNAEVIRSSGVTRQ